MTMVMSLATTNPNMTYMSTRKVTGAYVCPRVSGFSRIVGVDADTLGMEAAAATVALRCASGTQVCIQLQEVAAAEPSLQVPTCTGIERRLEVSVTGR